MEELKDRLFKHFVWPFFYKTLDKMSQFLIDLSHLKGKEDIQFDPIATFKTLSIKKPGGVSPIVRKTFLEANVFAVAVNKTGVLPKAVYFHFMFNVRRSLILVIFVKVQGNPPQYGK